MSKDDADILESSLEAPALDVVHSVVQFFRIAWYRRNMILAILVALSLLGALAYATATRIYESHASLLILQSGKDATTPSVGGDGADAKVMPTYQELLKSAIVLEGAVKHLPPKHRIDFRTHPQDKWARVLAANLSTSSVRNTNIIDVSYRSKNPYTAAEVVRAVIQSYLEFIDRTHKGTAADVIGVLTREKAKLEAALEQKQHELLAARSASGQIGLKRDGPVAPPLVQRVIDLNDLLTKAQEKRIEFQASLATIEQAVVKGEDLQQHILAVEETVGREILLSSLGLNSQDASVQSGLERKLLEDRAQLQTALREFGPAHPRVVEISDRIRLTEQYLQSYRNQLDYRLAELQQSQLGPTLVKMLTQSLAKAWEEEKSIARLFEDARREAVKLNGEMAELEILEHDVGRLRNSHDVLVNQIASIDLRQERGEIRAAVVEEPTPSLKPVSPQLVNIAAVCIFATILLGAVTVYVLDILDDRFRSPEELRMHLGVPVLAMVRKMSISDSEGLQSVQTHIAPDSAETEAFRTLRTALALNSRATGRIVISSSEPGDGKTTVLANLAVSYAQSGKRTLLIDADLRRPGMTALLNLKGRSGVSDILRAKDSVAELAEEYLCRTEVEGLDVLPAGPRRANPSEMLAGSRFGDLLAWADGAYDQILVDSPPVLAASDSQIVGQLVDGVILVVNAEKNHRHVAVRAVESFVALGVEVLGAVVNRISPNDSKGYGYGYGYGYEYHGHSDDETDSEHEAPVSMTLPQLSQAEENRPDESDPLDSRPKTGRIVPRRVA